MIVIGAGFGDEGKGLATSFLCSEQRKHVPVVRFNGGHQAGHTVVHNGHRHVFSSFGSGTLQGHLTCWSKFCTFAPENFMNELSALQHANIEPEIIVDSECPVTTPFDVIINHAENSRTGHGSVGVGFGQTLRRHENHHRIYAMDLLFPEILEEKLVGCYRYYKKNGYDLKVAPDLIDAFLKTCKDVIDYPKCKINSEREWQYGGTIMEGAQGILLDQDHGFFPNVTPSCTTSKNALMLDPDTRKIMYVTRVYHTRHGNGYFGRNTDPIQLRNNDDETNVENYQGQFRTKILDLDMLRYALTCDQIYSHDIFARHRHRVFERSIMITCLDQVDENNIPVYEGGQVMNYRLTQLLDRIPDFISRIYVSRGPSANDVTLERKQ